MDISAIARKVTLNQKKGCASRCASNLANTEPALHLTSAPVTLPGQVPTASFPATAMATAIAWVQRHSTLAQNAKTTRWGLSVRLVCRAMWETPKMEATVCLVKTSAMATQPTAFPSTLSTASGIHRGFYLTFHRIVRWVKSDRSMKTFCQSWSW